MPSHFTSDEIERGLAALVMADGNASRAAKDLAAAGGIRIAQRTLSEWKTTKADQLEDVRARLVPQLEEMRAQRLEALATTAAEVTNQALERMRETMGELSVKEIPGAARNAATVLGITTEKAQLLRQRPTAVVQHDHSAALRFLKRKGLIVEGEAIEVEATTP